MLQDFDAYKGYNGYTSAGNGSQSAANSSNNNIRKTLGLHKPPKIKPKKGGAYVSDTGGQPSNGGALSRARNGNDKGSSHSI